MKAVIMSGGSGTRLRPLTCNIPKPMVPIANKPVMEYIIELLKTHKINDIAVTLQYMPRAITDYFGDGNEFNVRIKYFTEHTPLGTAGSVKNTENFLSNTFIVISGDALTDINLTEAIKFHHEKNSFATLILKKVDVPTEYGIVVTDSSGKITTFLEKPSWSEVFSDTVNTGIYILSTDVLKFYKKGQIFDFSKDLFPLLLKNNLPMFGYITDEYWCDIGDLKAYSQAHIDVLDRKVNINIPGKLLFDNVWVGERTILEDGAIIESPCIIGKGCIIRRNSYISNYSVLGDQVDVSERSTIKKGVIWKKTHIGRGVQIRGSIICDHSRIQDRSLILEQSVIGGDTLVGEEVTIKPNVKIWPNKLIDNSSVISSNLIWGSKVSRYVFGMRGISGELNKEITVEYVAKLGVAYGSIFDKSAKIAVACNAVASSSLLKTSFITGLLSSGVNILDFGEIPLPVTRSAIRFHRASGGIHIGIYTEKNSTQKVYIDFLTQDGTNIDKSTERKIENLLAIEEFRRAPLSSTTKLKSIANYKEFYVMNMIHSIESNSIGYKIVIGACPSYIETILEETLKELGCKVEHFSIDYAEHEYNMCNEIKYDMELFCEFVQSNDFDMGVCVENNCEKMILVDNKGRIISEDMFMALICIILFKKTRSSIMIAPISASNVLDEIAKENSGNIIRTKTSEQDIMSTILKSSPKPDSVEQLIMHFDAVAGLIKILDFVSANNYKLSDIVEMIPDFYMNKRQVKCPWNVKGRVIRKLIEENIDKTVDIVEGVKIHEENGWVLVLPDSQRPVCNVISEGISTEFAKELTNMYIQKIINISSNE